MIIKLAAMNLNSSLFVEGLYEKENKQKSFTLQKKRKKSEKFWRLKMRQFSDSMKISKLHSAYSLSISSPSPYT